jgi:hypothetical protein
MLRFLVFLIHPLPLLGYEHTIPYKHSSPPLMKLLVKLFSKKPTLLVKLSCAKQDLKFQEVAFWSRQAVWHDP